jgi:hypothetical protein
MAEMPSARQVTSNKDMTTMIKLSGLPVDRQVTQDRLRSQLFVACQG